MHTTTSASSSSRSKNWPNAGIFFARLRQWGLSSKKNMSRAIIAEILPDRRKEIIRHYLTVSTLSHIMGIYAVARVDIGRAGGREWDQRPQHSLLHRPGLLEGPRGAGRGAAYDQRHLERLEEIKRRQAEGATLAEIAG